MCPPPQSRCRSARLHPPHPSLDTGAHDHARGRHRRRSMRRGEPIGSSGAPPTPFFGRDVSDFAKLATIHTLCFTWFSGVPPLTHSIIRAPTSISYPQRSQFHRAAKAPPAVWAVEQWKSPPNAALALNTQQTRAKASANVLHHKRRPGPSKPGSLLFPFPPPSPTPSPPVCAHGTCLARALTPRPDQSRQG